MNASHQSLSSLMQVYMSQPPQMNQNIDRRRIEVLLQINTVLLYKCIALQQYVMNQQNFHTAGYNEKKELYQNYLKRIHYNLTCLASINDIYSSTPGLKKNYTLPQIIYPPPECTELFDHYKLLNQLYPEAMPFFQKKMSLLRQQMQNQGKPQGQATSSLNTTSIDQQQMMRQRAMQQHQQAPGFPQQQNLSNIGTPSMNDWDMNPQSDFLKAQTSSIGGASNGTPNFTMNGHMASSNTNGIDSAGIDFNFQNTDAITRRSSDRGNIHSQMSQSLL